MRTFSAARHFHRNAQEYQKKRERRTVVKEAFAFENEREALGCAEFFKERQYRDRIGSRDERAENERDDDWDIDSYETERVFESESNEQGRNYERDHREKRNRTHVFKKFPVLDVVRRFEKQNREEYVEQHFRREAEVVEESGSRKRHRNAAYGETDGDERDGIREFEFF